MFPTADQVALAIVVACRLAGTNPILTAMGQVAHRESRGRHIAFAALIEVFPDARRMSIARCVGYRAIGSAMANLPTYRKTEWWNELWVDEVIGALVADQYGAQAA
jgi:hypothetical protein